MAAFNKIDEKLNSMVHVPKLEPIMNRLNTLEYIELKEMETNEQFLKDFLFDQEEIQKFNAECESIPEKANSLAKKNIEQYEKISKSIEEHSLLYKEYEEKRDEL